MNLTMPIPGDMRATGGEVGSSLGAGALGDNAGLSERNFGQQEVGR